MDKSNVFMTEKFNESKKGGPKEMQMAWESAELVYELASLPVTIVSFFLTDMFG